MDTEIVAVEVVITTGAVIERESIVVIEAPSGIAVVEHPGGIAAVGISEGERAWTT